ncbi:MAG: hypothetical protein MI923_07175 [Phycisphaerales bacterium]|nr:hypothetical protein [Phycisphaerales bacterium]
MVTDWPVVAKPTCGTSPESMRPASDVAMILSQPIWDSFLHEAGIAVEEP